MPRQQAHEPQRLSPRPGHCELQLLRPRAATTEVHAPAWSPCSTGEATAMRSPSTTTRGAAAHCNYRKLKKQQQRPSTARK